MTDEFILAVHTYGSNRVTDPQSRQTVSAHKIGYSNAASRILLELLGDKARDVTPSRASYYYIKISANIAVRHGYLLFKVGAAELAKAETIARNHFRPGTCLWRDGKWMELPSKQNPDYTDPGNYGKPDFNPTGFMITDTATGEKESATKTITIERSQRDPNEKPWWWVLGDTYPHRELLKKYGACFSPKRKAWYYIGWDLPKEIQALSDQNPPTISTVLPASDRETPTNIPDEDSPCSLQEAAQILGVRTTVILPAETAATPRLFQKDQTVYARYDLETPDGKPIPTGSSGKIVRLYNQNKQYGWSYDVEFEGIGNGWYFERELTDLEPLPGIQIKRGYVVPPDAASPETDAEIKRSLIETGQKPEAITSSEPNTATLTKAAPADKEEPPPIRVIKPQGLPAEGEPLDAIQTAIRQTKDQAPAATFQRQTTLRSKKLTIARIEQTPVGEITGSITGSVWCYGYGVHEGECIYLNMAGPRTAVEAMRAKLSKGEIVNLVPWDAPAIELTAGEGNKGRYTAYLQNIPEAKFMSAILVHDTIIQPNYGGKSRTFIFQASEEQAMAQLKHHITQLVKIPVFDEWTQYLWTAGQVAMLVRKTRGDGGLITWFVDLDIDSWTRLITGGTEQKIIALQGVNALSTPVITTVENTPAQTVTQ